MNRRVLGGLLLLVLVAGVAWWTQQNLGHPVDHGLTACKTHCKNMATAIEMYAEDNQGRYPATLARLIAGNYLKVLPCCPTAGRMTYTNYEVSQKPKNFSFTCVGNNHARQYQGFTTSSDNFPQYNGAEGLLDHP